jgi:chromate transport protein ChrA
LFWVILYNYISFYYTGNFFVFSYIDAQSYDITSQRMSNMPFKEGLNYASNYLSIDDMGAPLFISTCYRIIPSNLFVNFIYILLGLISAYSLYRISKEFMSIKYAKLCSIAFALSSYVIYYHSSGLKESIMIMLIILFFNYYYQFLKTNKLKHLFLSIFIALLFILFRIPIIFFIIAAVFVNALVGIKNIKVRIPLVVLAIILFITLYSFFQNSIDRYLLGGDITRLLIAQEEESMIKGGTRFTYLTNIVAQFIGPLPTILPIQEKQLLAFFAPGLFFRCFISIPFFLGIVYAIKNKDKLLYPMILFALFEMISLISIIEGLELRKSLPHLPFIYIIAFYYMDMYDLNKLNTRKYLSPIKINFLLILIFIIILVWNLRTEISIYHI